MTTYYVAKDGSDSADGSSSSPWKTINHAMASNLRPGDEVVVRPGTYTEEVWVTKNGAEDNYITLRSEVPGEALIRPPNGTITTVNIHANYFEIDGFDVVGGTGPAILGQEAHHIIVRNNIAHDSGGSGIAMYLSEFQLIENNLVYGNAGTSGYHTSGIAINSNINISGDTTTTGFRTIVRNNISHDNTETDAISGYHTDGNGIIIDWFRNDGMGYPAYDYPTLVENNLVYQNGGKGIQVFMSDNVTVRNNTAYHNNQDLQIPGIERGEITITQTAANAVVVNNIAVADPSINSNNTAFSIAHSSAVVENNLSFNGVNGQSAVALWNGATFRTSDGNILGVNPLFIDPENGNFKLANASAAIDAGTSARGLASIDLDGGWRAVGTVDIGAYENGSGPGSAPEPANSAPNAANDSGFTTEAGQALTLASSTLLANDSDPDGDILSVSSVGSASNGTVTLDRSGNVIFTPDADFSGTAAFTYTATDASGATDTARVTIEVQAAPNTGGSSGGTTDSGGGASSGGGSGGTTGGTGGTTGSGTDGTPDSTGGSSGSGEVTDEVFTIWSDSARPDIASDPDATSVQLGLKFHADVASEVDAVRFYKSAENTGVNSVSIWSADGKLLATQDVGALSGSGWQEIKLDNAVPLEAGQSYIVSYHTTSGHYSVSEGFFTGASDPGPISLESNAGVYAYGDSGNFPSQSYAASNYWVDVVLDTGGGSTEPSTGDSSGSAGGTGGTGNVETGGGSTGDTGTPDNSDAVDHSALIGESGVVVASQSSANVWQTVTFSETLDNPSVVMSAMSQNGADPFTIRVRNVTDHGFEYQIDEWDYLDGKHMAETLAWVAIESGVHTLADGRTIAAGETTVGANRTSVDFGDVSFGKNAVVFGQVTDDGNAFAVNDRIERVGSNGFAVRLEQQEASVGKISAESFDWIAIEKGASSDGTQLAGVTDDAICHDATSIGFAAGMVDESFAFLTDMQTRDGGNSATVGVLAVDADGATIEITEETSKDRETAHCHEVVGYAGFDTGLIYAADIPDLLVA
ncbi:DUF4082 domain-containing protein [Tropicimonas isoalkanivorans]|uniref:Parallel beta-helix repeat (Two copies) n=1 Tax=Tropicimonas isoalkanivorans TaxID=441112 RepID=A0A1I1LLK9_9RHOB|nr:DUF4082 domain-containing protein [Tropicimonas isoalkanivorans]SFC74014.1 parallel beta-helix repeat (two copies) [Tropicimonas isoalkanivorans]